MDLAVRDAYGWEDLDFGHGWVETVSTSGKKGKAASKDEGKKRGRKPKVEQSETLGLFGEET